MPYSHLVRKGDTLWGVCDFYFQNPYQWPRIWSYNPQIKNPHWIYPGDEAAASGRAPAAERERRFEQPAPRGLFERHEPRRPAPPGPEATRSSLRDQGWIHDATDDVWGDITGASVDKMFLSQYDQVYLHIDKGHSNT